MTHTVGWAPKTSDSLSQIANDKRTSNVDHAEVRTVFDSDGDIDTSCAVPQTPEGLECQPQNNLRRAVPESPAQLKYVTLPYSSLEERADSDYCSVHSKEFWHVNGTSVV